MEGRDSAYVKKKPCIIIRADGGSGLGMGHLVRSMTLAKGFATAGFTPVYAVKNAEDSVINFMKKTGVRFFSMVDVKDGDWDRESRLMAGLIEDTKPAVVFLDIDNAQTRKNLKGYGGYLDALRSGGTALAAIDGPSAPDYFYELFIAPYDGARRINPDSRTKHLLGADFVILRDEFVLAARQKRTIRKSADRVLISMGGADPKRLTEKILKALCPVTSKELQLKVLLGPAFTEQQHSAIINLAGEFGQRCEVLKNSSEMAALMLWADVGLISGGLTKYELAATGTPGISLAQNEEEDRLTALFATQKTLRHLGEGSAPAEEKLAKALLELLSDSDARKRMSSAGKHRVDGLGLDRVIQETTRLCNRIRKECPS